MYLFDLNISNIKSQALAQECPKRKVFWKNFAEPTEKQLCAGAFFIMKVQAAWMNQTFRFTLYSTQVFSSEIYETFKNTFWEHQQFSKTFALV